MNINNSYDLTPSDQNASPLQAATTSITIQGIFTVEETLVEDTESPEISLNGPSIIQLNLGETWADPAASASDNIDGDLTSSISIDGVVDPSTIGHIP